MESGESNPLSSQLSDLLPQIADDRGFIVDVAVTVLVLSILVMIAVELFKFVWKPLFQRQVLIHWEFDLYKRLKVEYRTLPAPSNYAEPDLAMPTSVPKGKIVHLHHAAFRLPRRLFMQQVENQAQRLLANPGRNPDSVKLLATGAAPYDVAQFVAWKPSETQIESTDTQISIGADIRERVIAAAEYNIDTLQLMLSTRWLSAVRMASVAIGILGAQALQVLESGPVDPVRTAFLVGIGLVSGVAASLVHDLLGQITGGDRDRY